MFDEDIEILSELGKGGFGKTYLVKCKKEKFVIKHMVFVGKVKRERWLKIVSSEKNALNLIHPNVIQIKQVIWQDANNVQFWMDYGGSQTLYHIIEECDSIDRYYCIKCLISGLKYIHEQNIVHLDFKPLNILYHNVTNTWKLSDFGASMNLVENVSDNDQDIPLSPNSPTQFYISCTIPFSAPEIFKGLAASKAMDIYSFACVMWCIFEGSNILYPNAMPNTIIFSVCSTNSRPQFKHALEIEKKLCEKSWRDDPQKRPTAQDLEEEIKML